MFRLPSLCALCAAHGIAIACCLTSGCSRNAHSASVDDRPLVQVTEPISREITEYAYFTGRMDAVETVEIRSRVDGYLVSVDFEPGSEVKKGQRLFQIDPRPYQAVFDRLEAETRVAEAHYRQAQADYERWTSLNKTPGAVSKQDLDSYTAKRDEAKAELSSCQAQARSASLNLEFTNIVSPIDGVVGRNLLTVGNLVEQDSTLLTTVVSEDPVFGYFDIDENTMLRIQQLIREGHMPGIRDTSRVSVEVGLSNERTDYPHKGELDFINNRVFAGTGTLQVRGTFANQRPGKNLPRPFYPGLFVRVRLPLGGPLPAMLVPEAAVSTDQGDRFVLVVNKHDTVEYRPVNLGPIQPGGWQVVEPMQVVRDNGGLRRARDGETGTASLEFGERVIVSGLQRVRQGSQVRTKPYQLSPAEMTER